MLDLFQPDIFSTAAPVFSHVTSEAAGRVGEVWSELAIDDAISGIEQSGGNEINSNNFKIATPHRAYLLKRLPETSGLARLEQGLALLQWLHAQGVPVPAVCAREGRPLIAHHDGSLWCAMEFVPGRFFHGGDAELAATAHAIGRMHHALTAVPHGIEPPERWPYDFSAAPDLLAVTARGRDQWIEHFGTRVAPMLDESWPALTSLASELAAAPPSWCARPWQPCHADLHPHNILVHQGRVSAFIDLEAFAMVPAAAALGFAAYKLTRQWASAEGPGRRTPGAVAAAGSRFVTTMADGAEGLLPPPADLHAGARVEVFRRLLLVLWLNAEGNRQWNHVLGLHLAGIQEIEAVFGLF